MDEDMLCCSVCLDMFVDPRNLECGHSYCLKCLCGLAKGSNITCPLCQIPTIKEPTSLPKSYVLQDLINQFHSTKNSGSTSSTTVATLPTSASPCTFCEVQTSLYCSACQQFICDSCSLQHEQFPLTKNHPPRIQVSATDPSNCPTHQLPLTQYCQDCYVRICTQCSSHTSHRVLPVEEAVQERRDYLRKHFGLKHQEDLVLQKESSLQLMKQKMEEKDTQIQTLKQQLKETKSERKQVRLEIDSTEQQLIALRKEIAPLSMAPCDILNQSKFCRMIQSLTRHTTNNATIQLRAAPFQQLSSLSTSRPSLDSMSFKRSKSSIGRVQQKASVSAQLVGGDDPPDGSRFEPNSPFIKVWHVRNSGHTVWPPGMDLVQISGDELQLTFGEVPQAHPGQCVDLTACGKVPSSPGNYVSHIRLRLPDTSPVGPRLWVDFNVQ